MVIDVRRFGGRGVLDGRYRALDLTDVKGAFCGKMLAELGVDVVKIEPPAGSSERTLAPFFHDLPHPERSLYWFAYNANKRGITLNLETANGRDLFRRLASRADFVLESFAPGYLDRLGLGYRGLAPINQGLILTSITPFGQSGPRAGYAASDLTILALGGLLNLDGDPDRPPLRFSIEQTFPQAGAQAAAASLIALHHRTNSGRGQHVDVSMQEAMTQANWLQQHFWDLERKVQRREGSARRRGDIALRTVHPCKDGYVSWRIFVSSMGSGTSALVKWMAEEGMAGDLIDVDFAKVDMNDLRQPEVEHWEGLIRGFFLTHTKSELFEQAIRRGIMLFPVADAMDLLEDRHLAERDFWTGVVHRELDTTIRYPGAPYRSTALRPVRTTRAPLLGEHNAEIYRGELGLAASDLIALKQAGVI